MKVSFKARLEKYGQNGDKTGWTYFVISARAAGKLNKGVKKSFRVKGWIDAYEISQVSILPCGDGSFMMPFNATMRKATRKKVGDTVEVALEADLSEIPLSPELLECLLDEPLARQEFESLPRSHQHYYSNWVESAKTEATRTKRIAIVINGLARKMDFGAMLREQRDLKLK
ncbi:MAG: YdeI/OmpD-associated family protein [Ferruginibacter sp.]